MAKRGKEQAGMSFAYTFPIEEMGILIPPTTIQLSSKFLQDELGVMRFDAHPDWQEGGKVTHVGCPFCKQGFLKLGKVEPEYRGGMDPLPQTKEHTANKYEYVCSNNECNGRFFGVYQWMWID